MRSVRCVAMAILASLVAGGASGADSDGAAGVDPARAWSEPLEVKLVSASRSIALAPFVDAEVWAARMGLEEFRVFSNGPDGSIVETTLLEQEWQDRREQLCAGPDVTGCESSQCQSIQLAGRVEAVGLEPATRTVARLLPNTPSLEHVLAARAAACEASSAATEAEPAAAGLPADPVSSEVTPTITVVDGVLDLSDQALPDDPENWTLAVAAGCSVIKTPLAALVPAMDRTRVVALISGPASAATAVGATHGLVLLTQRSLSALGETLALYQVPSGGSVAATVALLTGDVRVASAQPDYLYRTSAAAGDPFAFMNYGPERTGALRLHPSTTGGGQLVAVIDTGVNLDHPDLAGQIAEHRDLTGFGWSADVHGTAVAGIIAALAGNGIGSYGVAPGVRLLALKACQPVRPGGVDARCWTSTLVQALDAALAADARLVNLSLGGPPDPLVARYVTLATSRGKLLIAAAGNDGPSAKPAFPAALPEVVAVTATDAQDRAYRDATRGNFVDVAAPGVDIVVPGPERSYPSLSGTSLATAHFTGIAALVADLAPLLTNAELRGVLAANARDLGRPGDDEQFGAGLVDACAATAYATGEAVVCVEGKTDATP